jgi:hypothetical protein
MTIGKPLLQFAAHPLTMAAAMGLCLWTLLGLLHLDQLVGGSGSVSKRVTEPLAPASIPVAPATGSGALAAAQQVEGKIVKLDKANHEIALQRRAPGGTAGAAAAPTEQYRLDHDPSFDTLKVGDQITLKVDQLNGVPTATQILSK